MKIKFVSAAIVSALTLNACMGLSQQSHNEADFSSQKPSTSNRVDTLNATVGQEFEIKLGANPSTGYNWLISKLDKNFLEVTGQDFVPNAPAGVVGSPGTAVFKLKALKAGTTELTLQYKRSWSPDVLESKSYKIVIAGENASEEKPTLLCQLNRSQSIAIFAADQKVELIHFPSLKTKLELKTFVAGRCPYCFKFEGKAGNLQISASTRSQYAGSAIVTLLSTEINGKKQPDAICKTVAE